MSRFIFSKDDVIKFRNIPLKTNGSLLHKYENTFTGKVAIKFIKDNFNLSYDDALKWCKLFKQGNIIQPENYRLIQEFSPKSKYVYSLYPEDVQNLFWLEEGFEDNFESNEEIFNNNDSDNNIDGKEIPKIPTLPFLGNALDVTGSIGSNRTMCILGRELCPKYGEIFRIKIMQHNFIVVCEPALIEQACESPKFGKLTESDALFIELRTFRGDGLTTIADGPLHDQCQSIVAPALIKRCFANYAPILSETTNKSFQEEIGKKKDHINMREFFKKVTLRNIAMIAMGIDLYAGTKWNKFCDSLTFIVSEGISRAFKGTKYNPYNNHKFKSALKILKGNLIDVINTRKEEHKLQQKDPATHDLLDLMLTSPISEDNGRKIFMSDDLVRDNLLTILSAGHSTTTCMLSWACNFLFDLSLGNTDYRYMLLKEVDALAENDRKYIPSISDIYSKLSFMTCVLKETLRLAPPIPSLYRHCKQTTDLGGYTIKAGETIMISCIGTHLNPKFWDDPLTYNPYRFMDTTPQSYSFIPFAGGPRECIGREFAFLSGRIILFQLLNQYSLSLSPKARPYEDEHLFLFIENLLMNAIVRKKLPKSSLKNVIKQDKKKEKKEEKKEEKKPIVQFNDDVLENVKSVIRKNGYKATILAGTKSEFGSVNTIAQLLVDKALEFNFQLGDSPMSPNKYFAYIHDTIDTPMNILFIVVATYQGKPATNTMNAYNWLVSIIKRLESGEDLSKYLSNFHYVVFGCGNSNWETTYQKIAEYFDKNLERLGAKRICTRGIYNEAQDDIEELFSDFYTIMAPELLKLIPEVGKKKVSNFRKSLNSSNSFVKPLPSSSAHIVSICGDGEDIGYPPIIPSTQKKDIYQCSIKKIENITPNGDKATLHIEININNNMKYRAGDHLVVCPVMPDNIVKRVIAKFIDFDESTILRWSPQLKQSRKSRFHLPLSVSMSVKNILTNLLDLKALPSKQFLMNLSNIVENDDEVKELQNIGSDNNIYKEWIKTNSPISIVDVIEKYSVMGHELGRLMEFLPVLKPRSYSICSSPKIDSSTAHICVGVVEDKIGDKTYNGVCSYYLKTHLDESNPLVNVYTEEADETFDIPKDDNIPIILISAGTGFAPMRSFIQERKARNAKGEIYIFYGCRHESKDWLYSEELKQYQKEGLITDIFIGFSRSEQYPRQYVQEKIAEQEDLVWNLIENKNAYIYICGNGTRVGGGTRNILLDIIMKKTNKDKLNAEKYLSNLEFLGRYEQDVWG